MRKLLALGVILCSGVMTASAEPPRFPPALVVPDALGVNIHFTDPKPGEMEMLAGAGFRWVRMDFNWGGTERKAGEYDFGAYDRLMAALDPHGVRLKVAQVGHQVAQAEGRVDVLGVEGGEDDVGHGSNLRQDRGLVRLNAT